MPRFESNAQDADVLNQMHELTHEISDQRTQAILQSVIDAVALNPQPIPPGIQEIFQSVLDAIALNPQPLPPGPDDLQRSA